MCTRASEGPGPLLQVPAQSPGWLVAEMLLWVEWGTGGSLQQLPTAVQMALHCSLDGQDNAGPWRRLHNHAAQRGHQSRTNWFSRDESTEAPNSTRAFILCQTVFSQGPAYCSFLNRSSPWLFKRVNEAHKEAHNRVNPLFISDLMWTCFRK